MYGNKYSNIQRHINPLMFDVIDDKPEGAARGVYHVILHEGFITLFKNLYS